MTSLYVHDAEVDGRRVDVAIEGGRIVGCGESIRPPRTADVLDAHGGVLLPGLWDHHIHLLALGASLDSVPVGPPKVSDAPALADALRTADATSAPGSWIRAVGYHESVAGDLDRAALDALVADRPVRVQHRSGAQWTLNSRALALLGVGDQTHPGVERDGHGEPTGRLRGADRLLRELMAGDGVPDLRRVGALLARHGVVGVTDMTPYETVTDLAPLADATRAGDLRQHVVATGGPDITTAHFPEPLGRGPVKVLLADHALPALDDVARWIAHAHAAGRSVAIHCVTRTSLALALAAWDEAGGPRPGDRVEHGSVVPPAFHPPLATGGISVVTQPGFVSDRGEQYLVDVDVEDRAHLYPCRSLLAAGIPVGGSTDAPFGHVDPWRAIRAAVERTTRLGDAVAPGEAVPPHRALELFLGEPGDPGGSARRIGVGHAADLCLLDRPLRDALADPSADHVVATIIDGQVAHLR